jgi:hypothetical protein
LFNRGKVFSFFALWITKAKFFVEETLAAHGFFQELINKDDKQKHMRQNMLSK